MKIILLGHRYIAMKIKRMMILLAAAVAADGSNAMGETPCRL
jgi:hypothetical protein